jgi:hypothetical protein
MANESRGDKTAEERENEYIRGGKGRKDEVKGSGIYPASSPDAPADAEVRGPGELVGHKGARDKTTDKQVQKEDLSSGSE